MPCQPASPIGVLRAIRGDPAPSRIPVIPLSERGGEEWRASMDLGCELTTCADRLLP